MDKYITQYGIPECVTGANTVEDLDRWLRINPYPNYRLVSVMNMNGTFVLVWELKESDNNSSVPVQNSEPPDLFCLANGPEGDTVLVIK